MDAGVLSPTSLDGASAELTDRITVLRELFVKNYGQSPECYIRAPGRVNIIGEHIDYCGYSVLPMAIQQDILVAARRTGDQTLSLSNLNPAYESYTCSTTGISVDKAAGSVPWVSYVLCGVRGVQDEFQLTALSGMQLTIDGAVPVSSGLSSSSALVCAAAMTTIHLNQCKAGRKQVADLCARAERYVGTEGGGMDQAICLLAKPGSAQHIEFGPLRVQDVRLPSGATFVIANSMAEKNKAASSDYNCRVVECRLATQILAKKSGLKWSEFRRLGDLQQSLKKDLDEMVELTQIVLTAESYTKKQMCELLETTAAELDVVTLTENTRHLNVFLVRQRALHVLQEAARVRRFCAVASGGGEATLRQLGRLMTDSHVSCRDLYDCSHPRLDAICRLAKGVAYGARLTGAGWGGCTVALVSADRVREYIDKLKTEFYVGQLDCDESKLDSMVFATQPSHGANIYCP